MRKLLTLLTALAVVACFTVPATASTELLRNYTGADGVTVSSDSGRVTAKKSGWSGVIPGKYKTAVAFGTATTCTVTIQGSHDGTNWFPCVDNGGNAITWSKATMNKIYLWWDTFWKYRATYSKTGMGNKPVTVQINGSD